MNCTSIEIKMTRGVPKMGFARWVLKVTALLPILICVLAAEGKEISDAEIEAEVNDNGSFVRVSGSTYQFQQDTYIQGAEYSSLAIEQFHSRLITGKASVLPSAQSATWIPIAGDITIFIPKYQTIYPLNKLIGDGFVQSRLIRSQLYSQLGRNLITTVYENETQQIKNLYDNAFALANTVGFTKKFGERLVLQDIAVAGLDVIWPELRVVNGESVLVPIVHLTQSTLANQGVSGHQVEFIASNARFKNIEIKSGSITTRRDGLLLAAQNFVVGEGASITSSGDLNLAVGGTLLNYGNITAGQVLNITAGNYYQKTLVHRFRTAYGFNDHLGLISRVRVGDSLEIKSPANIVIQGSEIQAGTNIVFNANGDIKIGTVTLASGKELITSNTRYQESTLEHVQSSLSAGDNIKLMAAGMIEIDAATLHADRGHIELLAGMGIEVIEASNQVQTASHQKWRKTTVDESSYISIALRSVLDAGKGVVIHTDQEDIVLRAVEINSETGTSLDAKGGKVRLLMAKELDHYQRHATTENKWRVKSTDAGHVFENAVYPEIIGGLRVNALYGVEVEIKRPPSLWGAASFEQDIDWYIGTVANTPGLAWMNELKNDVDWSKVELLTREWRKVKRNLTPEAMALVSIAAAVATGGASLAGEGALAAAANAAISTVATQLTVSLAAGNSLDTALKTLDDDEFLESLATSMVTAGALSQLSQYSSFFPTGDKLSPLKQAQAIVVESAVQSTVSWAVKGGDFESLRDGFTTALATNAVERLGEIAAEEISDAAATYDIDRAIEYVAHAGAGCVIGLASSEIGGTSNSNACYSGAGGAIIGEFVGTLYEEAKVKKAKEYTEAWLKKYGVVGGPDLKGLSDQEIEAFVASSPIVTLSSINDLKQNGIDLARLSAALVAYAAGADVELAASSAETVAKYSALANFNQVMATVSAIDEYTSLESTVQLAEEIVAAIRSGSSHAVGEILLSYASQYPDLAYLQELSPVNALKVLSGILGSSLHGRIMAYEFRKFISSDAAEGLLSLNELEEGLTLAELSKEIRNRSIDYSDLPEDMKVAIKVELDGLYSAYNGKPPIEDLYEVMRSYVKVENRPKVDAAFGIAMGMGQVVVNTGSDLAATAEMVILAPDSLYQYLMHEVTGSADYASGHARVEGMYEGFRAVLSNPTLYVTAAVEAKIAEITTQYGENDFLFWKNVTVAVVSTAVALKAVVNFARDVGGEGLVPNEDFSISGSAQFSRIKDYAVNSNGVVRTRDEAISLARSHGIEIPDDINIQFVSNWKRADANAEYFDVGSRYNPDDWIEWDDFMAHRGEFAGTVPVRINQDVLNSDEAILANISHEMHELNALKTLFDQRGALRAKEIARLVNTRDRGGVSGNLHEQAWDISDSLILKIRGGN